MELWANYSLLFRYPKKDQKPRSFSSISNSTGIVLKDFIFDGQHERNPAKGTLLRSERVNITRGPAKKLLAAYSQLSAPERLSFFHPIFDLRTYFGRFWTFNTSTERITLEDTIRWGTLYSIDMLIYIGSILDNPIEESEASKEYSVFGDRLRQLQALIDQRFQLKTFKQLWIDRRDADMQSTTEHFGRLLLLILSVSY